MSVINDLRVKSFGGTYAAGESRVSLSADGVDANDLVGSLDDRLRREVLGEYLGRNDLLALQQALRHARGANEGKGMLDHWARLAGLIADWIAEGDSYEE